jgi:endoglucanase
VYVDAGHPGWISDIDQLAAALTSAGVKHAAGFSLDVSNFTPTAQDIAYGKQISAKLGGAHFVIDTSRNGAINPPAVTSGPSPTRNR